MSTSRRSKASRAVTLFGQALGRAGAFDTSAPMDGADDGNPFGSDAGDPPIGIEPTEASRTSPRPHLTARTYTVMARDGMQAIAQKLGAGARTHWYRELVSINLHKPIDPSTRAWFTLTPGEVINVPDVWPADESDARVASAVEVAWSPRSGAAPALLVLRDQLDARWPHRRRAQDGIVAHHAQNPRSDHEQGNALDVTRDPEHGPDLEALAGMLLADPRTHYVIFDRRIANPNREGGAWRPYGGGWRDPHKGHLHVSIRPEVREDARAWALDEGDPAARVTAPLAASIPPATYRAVRDDSTQGIAGKWPGSMVSEDAGAPETEDMGPNYMHSIVDLIDGGNAVWRWRPIDVSFQRPGDKQAVIATFWVLVDAVSDRRTGLRWPCSAAETQMVADRVRVRPQDLPNWWGPPGDALPCLMMTSRLSDARWLAARDSHEIIPPHPDSVKDLLLASSTRMNRAVNASLAALGRSDPWVADAGKIWILHRRVWDGSGRGAVNYAWHVQPTAKPLPFPVSHNAAIPGLWVIQDAGGMHDPYHWDYSQLCGLVAPYCMVARVGEDRKTPLLTADVYQSRELAGLVTDDGLPLQGVRQPYSQAALAASRASFWAEQARIYQGKVKRNIGLLNPRPADTSGMEAGDPQGTPGAYAGTSDGPPLDGLASMGLSVGETLLAHSGSAGSAAAAGAKLGGGDRRNRGHGGGHRRRRRGHHGRHHRGAFGGTRDRDDRRRSDRGRGGGELLGRQR